MHKGLTLVEVLVVITIIVITTSTGVLILRPQERQAEARDNVRLSDVATLERAINEFVLDNGSYPDTTMTLRESIVLPTGNTSLDNSASGWIDADLSTYTSRLPIDPINDSTYKYSYYHTLSAYEINAVLETFDTEAANDGGDDADVYEVGNDLTLLSP